MNTKNSIIEKCIAECKEAKQIIHELLETIQKKNVEEKQNERPSS